jgi:transketolase
VVALKAIDMINGEGALDVLLVATAPDTQALEPPARWRPTASVAVCFVHTVKPLDGDAIADAATRTRLVHGGKEHTVVGGLGSAVPALSDGSRAHCRC